MQRAPFGITKDGTAVERITLANDQLEVAFLTFGAVLHSVRLPGVPYSLTLGSEDLAAYEGPLVSYGSIMGPVVNRIEGARAVINGTECRFEANIPGGHTLHSGAAGTHNKVWTVLALGDDHLTLALDLPDGEGGFPGDRHVEVAYRLDGASLSLTISGQTSKPTLMSFANHSYWNLDGRHGYAGHRLRVAADRYLPTTDALIPSGQIAPVDGTLFDLRQGRVLAGDSSEFYDHNLCLSDARTALRDVAELTGTSGVNLTIATTEPGLQIYGGDTMGSGRFVGHLGQPYGAHDALALECQLWPNAPHNPAFPPIALNPGETYRQDTRFTFRAG